MVAQMLGVGPLCGGVIAGVLHTVLGPDHLSTIVTLSACQGAEAFWFGVRWAAGHLSGMILIGATIYTLNYRVGGEALEEYEHFANYAIGLVLVFFGSYFLLHADEYFDSEWRPRRATCACHDHAGDAESHPHGDAAHETTPLQRPQSESVAKVRKAGSTLVGFVQGVACPAGIVGLTFLRQYAGSSFQIAVFITVFLVATTLAMGFLAMGYGVLTERCVNSASLARGIYCTSCGLSLLLGTAWIVLNATGSLELVFPHDHDHGHGHGHEHHVHGHEHAHVHLQKDAVRMAMDQMFLIALPR